MQVADTDGSRIKINPLADFSRDDIANYIADHDLPRHPLVKQGYPSVGCAPCTAKATSTSNPRSGRWQNSAKTECGIHFINGRPMNGSRPQEDHQ